MKWSKINEMYIQQTVLRLVTKARSKKHCSGGIKNLWKIWYVTLCHRVNNLIVKITRGSWNLPNQRVPLGVMKSAAGCRQRKVKKSMLTINFKNLNWSRQIKLQFPTSWHWLAALICWWMLTGCTFLLFNVDCQSWPAEKTYFKAI